MINKTCMKHDKDIKDPSDDLEDLNDPIDKKGLIIVLATLIIMIAVVV